MIRRPTIRHFLLAAVSLLLLLVVQLCIVSALKQFARAETTMRIAETLVQFGCGLLSLLVLLTCFWWR